MMFGDLTCRKKQALALESISMTLGDVPFCLLRTVSANRQRG